MVIPHTYCHVYSICLHQHLHVAHLLDPVVELLSLQGVELCYEILELSPGHSKLRFLSLEFVCVVHTVVLVEVEPPVLGVLQIGHSDVAVDAFPKVSLVVLKLVFASFDVLFINRLNQFIYTEIRRILVSVHMYPQTAI